MEDIHKKMEVEYLRLEGIDIYSIDYKKSEDYERIKNTRVLWSGNSMTMEEYIERYLLEKDEVLDTYDSIYDMGNPSELTDSDCQYAALAEEVLNQIGKVDKNDIEAEISNLSKTFTRKGGLEWRLMKYLNFDVKLFDENNDRVKSEIFKIYYFFYMLENRDFPNTNVLKLLGNPSMENIDDSYYGTGTNNGMIIREIKNSLEKELDMEMQERIKSVLRDISNEWGGIHNEISSNLCNYSERKLIEIKDFMHSILINYCNVSDIIEYKHSPIETLYIKVCQHEYLGNIYDIAFANKIDTEKISEAPEGYIEGMKEFHFEKINYDEVENFIYENAQELAQYIHFKPKTSKEENRKVRNSKGKVIKVIDYWNRSNPVINIK